MSRFVSAEHAAALVRDGAALFDTRGALARLTRPLRGATAYAWKAWREGSGRTGLLPAEQGPLARWLIDRGATADRVVVVCGEGGQSWGEEGRLAWTLEVVLRHPQVVLVDGGAAALREAAPSASPPGPIRAPLAHRVLQDAVADALHHESTTLWDVRERDEWDGARRYAEARGGHLPGARHLPVTALFDDAGLLLPPDALRARLTGAGIPLHSPVLALCTGGVRSAMACAVLTHLGHPHAANYDGGIWEWSANPHRPLVTG